MLRMDMFLFAKGKQKANDGERLEKAERELELLRLAKVALDTQKTRRGVATVLLTIAAGGFMWRAAAAGEEEHGEEEEEEIVEDENVVQEEEIAEGGVGRIFSMTLPLTGLQDVSKAAADETSQPSKGVEDHEQRMLAWLLLNLWAQKVTGASTIEMRPLASPPLIAGEVVEADAIQEVVNESAGGGAGDASVELGGHANADADADADADAQPVEMVFNTWASLKQWLTALVTQPQLKTSKLVTLFLVGALSMEISSYTERLEKDISVQKYCRSLKDALQVRVGCVLGVFLPGVCCVLLYVFWRLTISWGGG